MLKHVGMLLIYIAHIFYGYARCEGWKLKDMEVTHKLLLAWRIITEESEGANSSPLEHVAAFNLRKISEQELVD